MPGETRADPHRLGQCHGGRVEPDGADEQQDPTALLGLRRGLGDGRRGEATETHAGQVAVDLVGAREAEERHHDQPGGQQPQEEPEGEGAGEQCASGVPVLPERIDDELDRDVLVPAVSRRRPAWACRSRPRPRSWLVRAGLARGRSASGGMAPMLRLPCGCSTSCPRGELEAGVLGPLPGRRRTRPAHPQSMMTRRRDGAMVGGWPDQSVGPADTDPVDQATGARGGDVMTYGRPQSRRQRRERAVGRAERNRCPCGTWPHSRPRSSGSGVATPSWSRRRRCGRDTPRGPPPWSSSPSSVRCA